MPDAARMTVTPAAGEPIWAVDTKKLYLGDGVTVGGIAAGANAYTHPANHPASIITQDASNRFVTDTEKATWNAKAGTAVATTTTAGLMASTDKTKLDGIAAGANTYTHPANHPASIITQDASNRFVTDTEKATWNAGVVPTGVVLYFARSTPPANFLKCNGAAVSRTTYAALFAVVGVGFGAGDGSTTFNLPDLRGRFLRGVDGAAGRDSDAAGRTAMNTGGNTGNSVGSVQGRALNSHAHTTAVRNTTGNTGLAGATSFASATISAGGYGQTNAADYAGPTSNTTGGNETRPVNAYVNYLIKY